MGLLCPELPMSLFSSPPPPPKFSHLLVFLYSFIRNLPRPVCEDPTPHPPPPPPWSEIHLSYFALQQLHVCLVHRLIETVHYIEIPLRFVFEKLGSLLAPPPFSFCRCSFLWPHFDVFRVPVISTLCLSSSPKMYFCFVFKPPLHCIILLTFVKKKKKKCSRSHER